MHIYICTYTYAHIHMHIYICTYTYAHICMHIYIYTYICICKHMICKQVYTNEKKYLYQYIRAGRLVRRRLQTHLWTQHCTHASVLGPKQFARFAWFCLHGSSGTCWSAHLQSWEDHIQSSWKENCNVAFPPWKDTSSIAFPPWKNTCNIAFPPWKKKLATSHFHPEKKLVT